MDKFIGFATDVVSMFVSRNSVPASELAALIGEVHAGFSRLENIELADARLVPAVSVPKSVQPDYLVCLDDGKRFKSLKSHLRKLGMTPEQYRSKWNLPSHYPMVAASYSAKRSAMAKEFGLGRSAAAEVKAKRGRPRKATNS